MTRHGGSTICTEDGRLVKNEPPPDTKPKSETEAKGPAKAGLVVSGHGKPTSRGKAGTSHPVKEDEDALP